MNEVIVPIILALIAAIPGVLAIWKQAQRERQLAKQEQSDFALELIQPYRERVRELENEVDVLREKVRILEEKMEHLNGIKRGARRLQSQVMSLGADPVYKVPDTGDLR